MTREWSHMKGEEESGKIWSLRDTRANWNNSWTSETVEEYHLCSVLEEALCPFNETVREASARKSLKEAQVGEREAQGFLRQNSISVTPWVEGKSSCLVTKSWMVIYAWRVEDLGRKLKIDLVRNHRWRTSHRALGQFFQEPLRVKEVKVVMGGLAIFFYCEKMCVKGGARMVVVALSTREVIRFPEVRTNDLSAVRVVESRLD